MSKRILIILSERGFSGEPLGPLETSYLTGQKMVEVLEHGLRGRGFFSEGD